MKRELKLDKATQMVLNNMLITVMTVSRAASAQNPCKHDSDPGADRDEKVG